MVLICNGFIFNCCACLCGKLRERIVKIENQGYQSSVEALSEKVIFFFSCSYFRCAKYYVINRCVKYYVFQYQTSIDYLNKYLLNMVTWSISKTGPHLSSGCYDNLQGSCKAQYAWWLSILRKERCNLILSLGFHVCFWKMVSCFSFSI